MLGRILLRPPAAASTLDHPLPDRTLAPVDTPAPVAKKKLPVARLAVAAVVILALSAVVLQIVGWRAAWVFIHDTVAWTIDRIAAAGPAAFFTAMALLPAVWVPISSFSLAAGPAFGARLGTGPVVALGLLAIGLNIALTYWLARRWLRPFFTRVLARFGYAIPEVPGGDMTDLIVVLRVTPGVPFAAQNYLLGLAQAPFVRYMVISCAVQWVLGAGMILFGDALAKGRGKMGLLAILLVLAAVFGAHLVRKHLAKSNA